jgi:hypothetical protein
MDCRPTKPAEFVMETTELVVLFSGKSQPIKIPCASRNDNPGKKKKATIGKKAFIDNTLAHNSNFGRDRYPYSSMWTIDHGTLNPPHGRLRVAVPTRIHVGN